MIEFSLTVFLVIYGLGVVLFFIFAIINMLHLFYYGFLNFESYFVTFLFLAATILVLFITYKLGIAIDWNQTFTI